MTALRILIAPCYGNPKSKRRFHRTIVETVDLRVGPGEHLTATQREVLTTLHQSNEARFWGATATHTRMMSALSQGDIVLFTGEKKLKAIGEVGYLFQNEKFADALWRHDDKEDGYAFIYSVTGIRHLDRDIGDLLSLPGFNPKDPLTGQRYVRDDQVEPIIEAFEIQSASVERKMVEGLQAKVGGSQVVPAEQRHTDSFVRDTSARADIAYRVESDLVLKYSAYCGHSTRYRTETGRYSDLYCEGDGEVEVVEAKSLATQEKVREAAAQLFDYAVHAPKPVTRLSGLFPEPPKAEALAYLARLGIDCLYPDGDGFARVEAPAARREYLLPVWRGE